MSREIHDQAERLLLKLSVEGLSPEEGSWLDGHLAGCPSCAEVAGRLEEVIGSLRTMTVAMSAALVEDTRAQVRLRAADPAPAGSVSRVLLWSAFASTWSWMLLSAPYIWRGCAWLGRRAGFADWIWEMGFGLWWLLPALSIGIALVVYKSIRDAYENGMTRV